MLRRSEAELVAQIRQALGGEQFDQAFADGSALSQREAVAAARAGSTAAVLPAAGNRFGPAFRRTRKPTEDLAVSYSEEVEDTELDAVNERVSHYSLLSGR
jgi:hypothetical protein